MRELGGNLEAGGTYIGAGYRRVISAASRHDVKLTDVTPTLKFFREQDLVLAGAIIRQSEWPDHPANPFPDSDKALMPWTFGRILTARDNSLEEPQDWLDPAQAGNDVSMYEWMRGLGLSDEAIRLGYGINVSYGEDGPRRVGAATAVPRGVFQGTEGLVRNGGHPAQWGDGCIPVPGNLFHGCRWLYGRRRRTAHTRSHGRVV